MVDSQRIQIFLVGLSIDHECHHKLPKEMRAREQLVVF